MPLNSFVLKHILERPALYDIGDQDFSGWYGTDYLGSTIQQGSVKVIFEEVVQPRIEENVLSLNNMETMFFYGSQESASLHKPNSSSFIVAIIYSAKNSCMFSVPVGVSR